MVNIRLTLTAAGDAGIVTRATRDRLVEMAKARFFADRSYRALLSEAREAGVPVDELDALRAWLPTGRVDQKREDALAMLGEMREFLAADPAPARVTYTFAASEMWQRAAAGAWDDMPASDGGENDAVMEEVRLDGAAYGRARRAALLRMLARRECERRDLAPAHLDRVRAETALRSRFGLPTRADLERWRTANDLDPAGLDELLEDEARLAGLEARIGAAPDAHVLDHLRTTGDYPRYAARARAKATMEARQALDGDAPDEWTRFRLTMWYFVARTGADVPEDVADYAARVGFPSVDAFYRALLREHRYLEAEASLRPEPEPR
jgi:hypothetical protein